MLPGIGVFGTGDIVRALVPFLRAKGFRVEAVWGRTLEAAENVATELNIPFHTNKVIARFDLINWSLQIKLTGTVLYSLN